MEFEFDSIKSATNKDKHDVDFETAKLLWLDEDMVEFAAKDHNEPRKIAVGSIYGKLWTAVFTYRYGRIRIISVRRARKSEVKLYEDI